MDEIWKAVLCYVRTEYEKKPRSRRVPIALSYLMWSFARRVFNCPLLTLPEDTDLVSKLKKTIAGFDGDTRITKLYTASHHGFSAAKFHEYVDGKKNTITIIKSNWGNRFGGYASAAFKQNESKPDGYDIDVILDPAAFVFAIGKEGADAGNNIKIFNKAKKYEDGFKEPKCIRYEANMGPLFGTADIVITNNCNGPVNLEKNLRASSFCCASTWGTKMKKGEKRTILCGQPATLGHPGGFGQLNLWELSQFHKGSLLYWNWFVVEEYVTFKLEFH